MSLAGLALLAFPHSGKAFEFKEEWVVKGGVKYQDGKILQFDNGHEVDIKVLDLPKLRKSSGRLVSMVKIKLSIS